MNKRIFISFAIEDEKYRDFIVGHSRNKKCPYEFVDMSVKVPWDSAWKEKCRSRIRGCDGVIVLITKNTFFASGVKWEIQCARSENIPMIGVQVFSDNRAQVPVELIIGGYKVIDWTYEGIDRFIESLGK